MMSLEEAIAYIENSVLSGVMSFFMTTSFARIAVEVADDFDPMHPIEITYWKEAPKTKWSMKHKNANADLYVSVGINDKESRTFVHLKSIEIIHRCFFLKCLGIDIGEDIADATTIAYLKNVEGRNITDNYIESQFCKIHFKTLVKGDEMVHNMVKGMIERRTEAANKVLKYGKMLISMNTNFISFATEYNRDIFTILCYLIVDVEDPRVMNTSNFTLICQKAAEYLSGY